MTRLLVNNGEKQFRFRHGNGLRLVKSESSPDREAPAKRIDLGAFLIGLIEQCRRHLAPGIILSLNSRLGDGARVDPREALVLQFVVCEIVTNARRYAHPEGAPVEITMECRATAHGEIIIDIGDDGVGLSPDFAEWRDAGHGMAAIRAKLQDIEAALNVTSDDLGLRFQIILHPSRHVRPRRGNFVWL